MCRSLGQFFIRCARENFQKPPKAPRIDHVFRTNPAHIQYIFSTYLVQIEFGYWTYPQLKKSPRANFEGFFAIFRNLPIDKNSFQTNKIYSSNDMT